MNRFIDQKIDKKNLIFDPVVYVEKKFYETKRKWKIYKCLYIFLSIISLLLVFSSLFLTTIVFSKLIITTVPDWFLYSTASFSALSGLITSVLTHFVVRDSYKKNKVNQKFIAGEIIKYSNETSFYTKENKDYMIYLSISAKLGNKDSQLELKSKEIKID
ncbi:MAG: DUF4231 domain-containing protein [Mollicutes bacterium PWAP]|nr:DUF4231 domain-containing protein [Mollicutes bacterium PWAP]